MVIKNISSKVIGIAGKVVMPDETVTVLENEGATPAVYKLVENGFLEILEEKAEEVKETKPRTRKK